MPLDLRTRLAQLEARLGVGQPKAASASAEVSAPASPLAARLQRLAAVQREQPARRPVTPAELARLLRGDLCADGVIMVDQSIPLSQLHGMVRLQEIERAPLAFLARGAAPALRGLLFIDTETTGLAGGTGTLAFVFGLARIVGPAVEVRQYLLTSYGAEPAMLAHALGWINEASHLVSFNGKTFDLPLLTTRYRLSRINCPLPALPHIDLLHSTRAAFRRHWPDCKLQTAERLLLRFFREDEVSGHMIPEIWSDWLQQGETDGLRGVVHHNRLDVVSLVALLAVLGRAFAEPGHVRADPLGIARAHRRAGDDGAALLHLTDSGEPLSGDARLELAALHAREKNWTRYVPLLQDLAAARDLRAMERLAKYYEHQEKDYQAALHWTEQMLNHAYDVEAAGKRRTRLQGKLSAPSGQTGKQRRSMT